MARPKEFDRDEALRTAMNVFWERGYEATTTDDLRRAMGIGRQSLYDTFGDKRRLFGEAFELYNTESGAVFRAILDNHPSALAAIEAILMAVPLQSVAERARGCLFVNTAAELASKDAVIGDAVRSLTASGAAQFERAIRRAQAAGEIGADVDAKAGGQYLFSTLQGLRLSAKAGASPRALREIVRMALRALGAS